jgi:hypothetical protein
MSCFLCPADAVVEREPIDELKDQLQLVLTLYPDASYPSIITCDGSLFTTLLNEEILGIDLTSTISAIQSAAKHFSFIMGLTGCPHLQINGDTQIFSLYGLDGGFILVFFNNKSNLSDTMELGTNAIRHGVLKVVQDLNEVINQKLPARSGNSNTVTVPKV